MSPAMGGTNQPRYLTFEPRHVDDSSSIAYRSDVNMAATQFLYAKRDQGALPWEMRAPRIVEHLIASGASIIFLQEVERDAFNEVFVPQLGAAG